jgi:predicted transcriptional regulator
MRGKASGVNAVQRQLMQYLRAGDWILVSKLPISVGQRTLDRIAEKGWIERRGGGPRSEIKLTPSGLKALQTPI